MMVIEIPLRVRFEADQRGTEFFQGRDINSANTWTEFCYPICPVGISSPFNLSF